MIPALTYYFWHSSWHSIWYISGHSIWHFVWHSIWHIFYNILSGIWHIFWHSIWHSICNLSGILCDVFGSRRAQLHPELAEEETMRKRRRGEGGGGGGGGWRSCTFEKKPEILTWQVGKNQVVESFAITKPLNMIWLSYIKFPTNLLYIIIWYVKSYFIIYK